MIARGEVYLVDWSPARGSEQSGMRPAVILQNDVGNRFSSTTIVAAISTRFRRPYPFHVAIGAAESGLPEDSVVKLDQVLTVDQGRLVRRVGVLSQERMREVARAIHHSLALTECGGVP